MNDEPPKKRTSCRLRAHVSYAKATRTLRWLKTVMTLLVEAISVKIRSHVIGSCYHRNDYAFEVDMVRAGDVPVANELVR